MASSLAPVILTLKADGVIAKGKAVKIGSDSDHVAVCVLATDKAIGLAQNVAAAAGDLVEVAVEGGARALAQTTIAAGKLLVPHTDGALKPIAAGGDRLVAVAMDGAVAGDIFDVLIVHGQAQGVES